MKKRVVLISGATSTLGAELTKVFARKRHHLLLLTYKNETQQSLLDQWLMAKLPRQAWRWYRGSLINQQSLSKWLTKAETEWGSIDCLINNAAIHLNHSVIRTSGKDWDEVFAINLKGARFLTKALLKGMIKHKKGQLIHISSWQALKGGYFSSSYSASKAALLGLSKSMAQEYGRYNICSNVIFPGYMPSRLTQGNSRKMLASVLKENCLGRLNDPKEVAKFIYNLSLMKNVSGQLFNLDSRILS